MLSAFECFQHAARYEQMAKDAASENDQEFLRSAAHRWWLLGKEATAAEKAAQAPKPPGGPDSSRF